MKKILITGARGQLAQALKEVFNDSSEVYLLGKDRLDITLWDDVNDAISSIKPQVLINCAAYTNVDGCESFPEKAFMVNSVGPLYLARACSSHGVKLVHISTDYVFSGEKSVPYTECDTPHPLSVYGISKLAGDLQVLSVLPSATVVRVSGLYGRALKEGAYNFVLFVIKSAMERGEVTLVSDHVLSPSYTLDIAFGIKKLLDEAVEGVVHLANEGAVSWAQFGRAVLEECSLKAEVREVTWADLNRPARRPRFSAIASVRLNWKLPHWRDALKRYIKTTGT